MLGFLVLCTILVAPQAFAAGKKMDLTVTTVIDNASECPAGFSSKFTVERIYSMYSSGAGYAPYYISTKDINIINNKSTTLSYDAFSWATCDLYYFKANQYTDKHLSLVAVEYTSADNLKAYTYSPTGVLPNDYAIKPFNWVEVINENKPAKVTLHFRYNPDIDSVQPDPDPDPGHTKTVDYLGDGVANPDTDANGLNDYRLSLDLLTQQATQDNKADIIFVLDVSGSMNEMLPSGQTRMSLLKSTMRDAINNLTSNPNNRISIIQFASESEILITGSTDREKLLKHINSLEANGGTNYYQSLKHAVDQVNDLTSTDTLGREKVVIFLTDGEPTFAAPAIKNANTNNYYAGFIYACESARRFSNVDKFYSVFIGDNSGSASTLQSITQMVSVSKERYMVQATNEQQLRDTFTRFMSKMSNTLYDVVITDGLSDYVDYIGDLKVAKAVGDQKPVYLTPGIDYSVTAGTKNVTVKFLKPLGAESKYTVSFNVRSSDKALMEYQSNPSFPHVGDEGTDYPGNTTSSGKPGFYSNTEATLKYSFGTNGSAVSTYKKPVVQVVEPAPISADIKLTKVLEGKDLEDGMFDFNVYQVTKDGDVHLGTVTHDADGNILLDNLDAMKVKKLGTFTYKFTEVKPDNPIKGVVYDTRTLVVNVEVTRKDDQLVTVVSYPDGQQFVNTYAPEPVEVILEAKKVLAGKPLAGDMFKFSLTNNYGTEVGKATNNANGNIRFDPLHITKEGEYKYYIREVVPLPNPDPHMHYSQLTVEVKIVVDDIGGALKADVSYSTDPVFYNEYKPTPTTGTIKVTKVLTGMQLTAGQFSFELKNLDTGSTKILTNAADGSIVETITYDQAGVYRYSIKEIPPETRDPNMTYDPRTIYVTVTVTDNGGQLNPSVKYEGGEEFINSYRNSGGIW
jgi:pilin isopeptide linkage protein